MTKIKELLDAAKEAKGVKTKYALAKALELHSGLISDYYAGKRFPDEYACLQIAKALGRSYEEVSAIVRIEAEKDESRREVWREHLKRLGGYAAGIIPLFLAGMLFVTFIVTYPIQSLANTRDESATLTSNTNYAMFRRIKTQISIVLHRLATLIPRVCPAY